MKEAIPCLRALFFSACFLVSLNGGDAIAEGVMLYPDTPAEPNEFGEVLVETSYQEHDLVFAFRDYESYQAAFAGGPLYLELPQENYLIGTSSGHSILVDGDIHQAAGMASGQICGDRIAITGAALPNGDNVLVAVQDPNRPGPWTAGASKECPFWGASSDCKTTKECEDEITVTNPFHGIIGPKEITVMAPGFCWRNKIDWFPDTCECSTKAVKVTIDVVKQWVKDNL